MGAVTSTIEFHTFVLKLPIRHPVVYAKEATSLAVLTGNRFVLGVGSSPWPDDYEIVRLPWEGRGRRFDECIEIVRGLAAGGYFEFHGEFYDFPAIKLEPVPSRPIPVLIGGHADANLRRAARLGDGWMARRRHDRRPHPDDRPHRTSCAASTAASASRSRSTPPRPSRSPPTASSDSRTSVSPTPRVASVASTRTGSRPTRRASKRRSTTCDRYADEVIAAVR